MTPQLLRRYTQAQDQLVQVMMPTTPIHTYDLPDINQEVVLRKMLLRQQLDATRRNQ